MVAQLDHLVESADRKNINLQVVRTAVGAHAGMCGMFFVLDFPDPHDAPLAYVETATGGFIFDAAWRKSTLSNEKVACVEVAPLQNAIAVRDSKHPDGPALAFGETEWRAFIEATKRSHLGA